MTPAGPARSPAALYVHVPFCVSLCPYCDFVVLAGSAARGPRSRMADYLAALHVEIDLRADVLDARHGPPDAAARPPLDSAYLGGGTPSLLPPAALAGLLDRIRDRFGMASGAEVTLEVNPGPDERGDLVAAAAAGVTRLSVGAQSLDAAELARIGRRHGPDDIRATIAEARRAGVRSVSLDLLYDIPGQTLATWSATLVAALSLAPDHLSLYALTLDDPDAEGLTGPLGDHLPTSTGARRWRAAARAAQDEDVAAACYEAACEILTDAGYLGYEISNWALPGHESRHNLAYWERRPHEAVGLGAHAFDGRERRWNAARLDGYLAALRPTAEAGEGGAGAAQGHGGGGRAHEPGVGAPRPVLPPGDAEIVDDATAAAEVVVLGLRLDRGIPAGMADDPRFADAIAWARATGLVEDAGPLEDAGADARPADRDAPGPRAGPGVEPGPGVAAGPGVDAAPGDLPHDAGMAAPATTEPSSTATAVSGGRIRLTLRGRLLSNELFARLV
jgi:oxygen-independent coproporphyrinogen-3 oxidase